jgi:hypothetical protein
MQRPARTMLQAADTRKSLLVLCDGTAGDTYKFFKLTGEDMTEPIGTIHTRNKFYALVLKIQ